MRTWPVRQAALVLAGLAVLLGWVLLGRHAADDLRSSDRHAFSFADTECDPPGPLSRADFLSEVQYLADLPDRLSPLEDGLAARLATAFAAHPWVESVERVELLPGRARVRLAYRTAVLLVPHAVGAKQATAPEQRPVDGRGVLLPRAAAVPGLPEFAGEASAPAGGAGQPWGDPRVEAAARTAAALYPHRDRLKIDTITVRGGVVELRAGDARVRWGRPPGQEYEGELNVAAKVTQLVEILTSPKQPQNREYDLRYSSPTP
jgi:hypothetical protein